MSQGPEARQELLMKQGGPFRNLTMNIPNKDREATHQPSPLFAIHPTRHIPLVNSPNNQTPSRFVKSPVGAGEYRLVGTPPLAKQNFAVTNVTEKEPWMPMENVRKTFSLFTIIMTMLVAVEIVDMSQNTNYLNFAKLVMSLVLFSVAVVGQLFKSHIMMIFSAVLNTTVLGSTLTAVMVLFGPMKMFNAFGVLPVSIVLIILALCYSVVYALKYRAEQVASYVSSGECSEVGTSSKVTSPYVVIAGA